MGVSTINPKTAEVITDIWKILRPTCKNDRTAVKKVTDHINKERLIRKRIGANTVASYTSLLKLRQPFARLKKVHAVSNGHVKDVELPQIDVLREMILLIDKINSMPETARNLIKECIK